MKRLILVFATLLLALNATAQELPTSRAVRGSAVQSDQQHGALLYCREMSHDFGDVNRREGEVKHLFSIENRGDKPLIITNVVSSCSCMKYSMSLKPIAPNERRMLRVTYELKKMPPGRFSKAVVIYSTSRDNAAANFTLMGYSTQTTRREYKEESK